MEVGYWLSAVGGRNILDGFWQTSDQQKSVGSLRVLIALT